MSSTSACSSARRASAEAAFAVSSSWRRRAASELAPRGARVGAAAELVLAAEPVEHLELVRRPREAALLELPRHRDHALDRGGDVLAGRRAAPRVRARAPASGDAPRDEQRVLVLRLQLRELVELRPATSSSAST